MGTVVILDRDGVINIDDPDCILAPDAWVPLPGSLEAIAALTAAGMEVAVATNQAAIGRGRLTEAGLDAIHARMQDAVAAAGGRIGVVVHCPHRPEDGCGCRKPAPGLLQRVADRLNLQLPDDSVVFIGDSLRDLQAARAAGCRPLLVRTGNGAETAAGLPDDLQGAVAIFDDLSAAAQHLLETS